MVAVRWVLLLAAVHTWSGGAICAAIATAALAELARKHLYPGSVI